MSGSNLAQLPGYFQEVWQNVGNDRLKLCIWAPKKPNQQNSDFYCTGFNSASQDFIALYEENNLGVFHFEKLSYDHQAYSILKVKGKDKIDVAFGMDDKSIGMIHKLPDTGLGTNRLRWTGMYKLGGGFNKYVRYLYQFFDDYFLTFDAKRPTVFLFEINNPGLGDGTATSPPPLVDVEPFHKFDPDPGNNVMHLVMVGEDIWIFRTVISGTSDQRICRYQHDFKTANPKTSMVVSQERCINSLFQGSDGRVLAQSSKNDQDKIILIDKGSGTSAVYIWDSRTETTATKLIINPTTIPGHTVDIFSGTPLHEATDDFIFFTSKGIQGFFLYQLSTEEVVSHQDSLPGTYSQETVMFWSPGKKMVIIYSALGTDRHAGKIRALRLQGDCEPTCDTCFDNSELIDRCLTCKPDKALVSDGVLTGGYCNGCSTDCLTCFGTGINQCSSCKNDKFVKNGSCLESCPVGETVNPANKVCEKCVPNCLTCSTSAYTCISCPPGKFINENDSKCYVECPFGKYGAAPTASCEICHISCESCTGPNDDQCKSCLPPGILLENSCQIDPNTYFIQKSSKQQTKENYGLVLDILIIDDEKKIVNLLTGKGTILNQDTLKFQIEGEEGALLQSTIFINSNNILQAGINLPDNLITGESYKLLSQTNQKKLYKNLIPHQQIELLLKQTGFISFQNAKFIPETELSATKSKGELAADSMSYTAGSMTVLNLVTAVLSADQSGSTMKFSQISKLISRLRLINLEFGRLLSSFMDGISIAFDKKERNREAILAGQNGDKAKFSYYGVKLFLVEFTASGWIGVLKLGLYLLSWITKIFFIWKLKVMKANKEISQKIFKGVRIHQQIHFLLYNLNVIDIVFYGLRTLAHCKFTKNWGGLVFSFIFVEAMVLDTWAISSISFSANFTITEENSILTKKKVQISESLDNLRQETEIKWRKKHRLADEYVESHSIRSEDLERFSYKKQIDYSTTFRRLETNEVITNHAIAELREDPKLLSHRLLLLANFAFLLRLVLYHIFLVGLPFSPTLQVFGCFMTEVGYTTLVGWGYCKHKHLRQRYLFISKTAQSLFLMVFHFLCMIISLKYRNTPVPYLIQQVGVYSILISVILEYLFLGFSIVLIIKKVITERKKKNKKTAKKEDKLIFYEWVKRKNMGVRLFPKELKISKSKGKQTKIKNKSKALNSVRGGGVLRRLRKSRNTKKRRSPLQKINEVKGILEEVPVSSQRVLIPSLSHGLNDNEDGTTEVRKGCKDPFIIFLDGFSRKIQKLNTKRKEKDSK